MDAKAPAIRPESVPRRTPRREWGLASRRLDPSWRYTAVTRAGTLAVVVGEPKTIEEALGRPYADASLFDNGLVNPSRRGKFWPP